ncbi:MAG: RNA polymerase sigma factor [Phycisphaerae bacterium]|nr:RNA polymerase sigma factor [Phycisphaerae bacterium]
MYNSNVQNPDFDDIRASIDGDGEAYKRLMQRYQADIARLMWRFSRDRNICERLVQDVFVEVYFSLNSFQGKAPFVHWLRKIATRTGYKFWKHRDKQKEIVSLEDFDFVKQQPDDDIESEKAGEIIYSLLGRMGRADRLVLTLMYLEGLTIEQIADQTGWTRAAVKMRAMRARKKIRRIAEKENIWEKLGWTK